MQTVLTDTCFWLALVDKKDQHHSNANEIAKLIDGNQIIIPWPCLYETLSTHLARRRDRMIYFEELIGKPNIILFDDNEYKINALKETFALNKFGHTLSLTDSIIREILKNINVRIHYLITFNNSDFEDICQQRQIEIFS